MQAGVYSARVKKQTGCDGSMEIGRAGIEMRLFNCVEMFCFVRLLQMVLCHSIRITVS